MKNPYAVSVLPKNSAIALFLALVCLLPTLALGQDKVAVMVSILPQVWFVEEIGGDQVLVEALVGPGHSPATFEPTTKQMVRLQAAKAFFSALAYSSVFVGSTRIPAFPTISRLIGSSFATTGNPLAIASTKTISKEK